MKKKPTQSEGKPSGKNAGKTPAIRTRMIRLQAIKTILEFGHHDSAQTFALEQILAFKKLKNVDHKKKHQCG